MLFIARFLLYMYWPGPGMLRHCIPICWTFGPVQIWRQNNETHPETNLLCSSGCVSSCKDSCISLFTRVAARACLLFVFCRCETPCFGYVFVCCVCVLCVCLCACCETLRTCTVVCMSFLCYVFLGCDVFFEGWANNKLNISQTESIQQEVEILLLSLFSYFAWFRACVG